MTSLYSFAAAIILSSIMLTQDVVDASIYQNIGIGICKPESGSYHYILKRDYEVNSHNDCATACDQIHVDEETRPHFRGFSHIRTSNLRIPDHSCMCFYDAGHLPGFDVLGENAEEKWSRDTRGSGQGEVRDADGTVGVGCYEMVVEEAVVPNGDVPEVILNGYKDAN